MDSLRILHASDLHVGLIARMRSPKAKFYSPRRWIRALKYNFANSFDPSVLKPFSEFVTNCDDIDAVLLTGDIATTGDFYDLTTAYRFIRGPASWIHIGRPEQFSQNGSLENVARPIFLIPGNHDRYTKKTPPTIFEPGDREFHKVFSDFWDTDVKEFSIIGDDRFAVSIIGADFSLRRANDCERYPFVEKYAQGRVYDDILEHLVRTTQAVKNRRVDRLVILWAIHFPPEFPAQSSIFKLIDSEKVIEAANKCGVLGILSGHTHIQKRYRTKRMNFEVFCAGTISEYESETGHSFQILTISDTMTRPQIHLQQFEFDRRLARFREVRNS